MTGDKYKQFGPFETLEEAAHAHSNARQELDRAGRSCGDAAPRAVPGMREAGAQIGSRVVSEDKTTQGWHDGIVAEKADLSLWRSNNSSGYRGVYRTQSRMYVAQISHGGRMKTLGTFKSAEEAAQVFAKEHQRIHGVLRQERHGTEGAAPDAVCEAAGKDDAPVTTGNRARGTFELHPAAKQFVKRLVDTNAGIVCAQVHAFDMRSMCSCSIAFAWSKARPYLGKSEAGRDTVV